MLAQWKRPNTSRGNTNWAKAVQKKCDSKNISKFTVAKKYSARNKYF